MALLKRDDYLAHLRGDALALVGVARLHGDAPVPSCPGWTVNQLIAHTGRVHRMAAAVVVNQLLVPPGPDLVGRPPTEPGELLPWFDEGIENLIRALATADPAAPAWNFVGLAPKAEFWVRRQAHETSIHRWDGQSALGQVTSIGSDLAVDGVDELFMLLGARLPQAKPEASTGGSLHLHATDAEGEWTVQIKNGIVGVELGHAKGDAALRASASDLNLFVWGRLDPLDDGGDVGFEVFGNDTVIRSFAAITGF